MKWKIVTKFIGPNEAAIGIIYADGSSQEVIRVLFPADGMLGENTKTCDEFERIMRKRLNNSC